MSGPRLGRRLAAEGLGTALLLATVVGSGIMAAGLAAGNTALALLGNTLPTGAILFVLIVLFGPVSGAHFNPAVSLTMLLDRRMPAGEAALYVAVQIAGAVAGVWLAHAMFDADLLQFGVKMRSGNGQWLSEGVATFGLVLTVLLAGRRGLETVAACVGLYITAAYWFTASTSFANPAVTLARGLTGSFSGIRPVDVPAFMLMQFLGAAAAFAVSRSVFHIEE